MVDEWDGVGIVDMDGVKARIAALEAELTRARTERDVAREALDDIMEYFRDCESAVDAIQEKFDYGELTRCWLDRAVKDFKNITASIRQINARAAIKA